MQTRVRRTAIAGSYPLGGEGRHRPRQLWQDVRLGRVQGQTSPALEERGRACQAKEGVTEGGAKTDPSFVLCSGVHTYK